MNKKFKSKRAVKREIFNMLYVLLGTVSMAVAVGMFLKPFNLVTGGISGLSIALYNITNKFFTIPIAGRDYTMEIYTAIITWALFFIGWIFLGRKFALKTVVSSISYTVLLPIITTLTASDWFFGGMFDLTKYVADNGTGNSGNFYAAAIVAAVFGGVLIGVGCALTFRGGGSTGGLDILALIVVKYAKRVKSSVMVFVFDASVVVFGIFAVRDFIMSLLGITSAFVVAFVIDKVFIGEKKAFIANIISDEHTKIRKAIISKLDRTCTIIEAKGGYTDTKRPIIMVSFTMPEYAALLAIVDSIDKNAFITIHRAQEINGEGFTKYDVKKKDK